MKIAYFDCSSGIAGNMVLGALIDAGVNPTLLREKLHKLQGTRYKRQINYKLKISKIKHNGLVSTNVEVKFKREKQHRNLQDILKIIRQSKLSKQVKAQSTKIFTRLAEAEAKVHGVKTNQVHFHEVGAVDAIIDIVGSCICLEILGIEKIFASPLPIGKGTIKHVHGILPIPAPATAQLIKGIPTYGVDVKAELVTPTGAAIISTLATGFVDIPRMKIEKIGAGSGSLTFPNLPNQLRVFIGEAELPTQKDTILQIETNIDDMAPESFAGTIRKLMQAGALDAFITPILMKKNRTATLLTVLCLPENREHILNSLFDVTTTLGVRISLVSREKLKRNIINIKTKYGEAKIKLGKLGGKIKTIAPEYEDYKKIAEKHHIPIQKAYKSIKESTWKKISPGK
ncbi:MAG: nickel pincer cofactor biosynthesis protein LarC [Candidatus Margulisiibacteriota bacterium]